MPTVRPHATVLIVFVRLLSFEVATAQPQYELSSGLRPFHTLAVESSVSLPITFGSTAVELNELQGETFSIVGREIAFGEGGRIFVRGRGGIDIVDGPSTIRIYALLSFYDTTDENARVSYTVEGEPGNRLLTVEWRDGKLIDVENGEHVTFQLKLHQSGVIEFHYGPNSLPESYTYPGFAYVAHSIPPADRYESIYMVIGDPRNPSLLWERTATIDLYAMDRIPPEGTVFRLTPQPVSSVRSFLMETTPVETMEYAGPNPATDRLIVRWNDKFIGETELTLSNAEGKEVHRALVPGTETVVDVSALPAGVYLVAVRQGASLSTRKVMVQ